MLPPPRRTSRRVTAPLVAALVGASLVGAACTPGGGTASTSTTLDAAQQAVVSTNEALGAAKSYEQRTGTYVGASSTALAAIGWSISWVPGDRSSTGPTTASVAGGADFVSLAVAAGGGRCDRTIDVPPPARPALLDHFHAVLRHLHLFFGGSYYQVTTGATCAAGPVPTTGWTTHLPVAH